MVNLAYTLMRYVWHEGEVRQHDRADGDRSRHDAEIEQPPSAERHIGSSSDNLVASTRAQSHENPVRRAAQAPKKQHNCAIGVAVLSSLFVG